MKNLIKFLEINLAATLVVVGIIVWCIIGIMNFHPNLDWLECIIYFISLLLLVLQFSLWRNHKMFNKELLYFFLTMLIGNVSMFLLALNSSYIRLSSLSFVLALGAIATICSFIVVLKILAWSFNSLIKGK